MGECSSELSLWLMKRFIGQRCSWNEHGRLWTDWLLNEFLLQKLAEEQAKAKRRAEAVELVMQGLRVQLEDLKSRNDESVLTILQLVPRQSRSLLFIKFMLWYYAQKSMVKSLTILLLPISFVIGCVWSFISGWVLLGNKYLCYYYCCCFFVISSFIYLSCVCICCM